MTNEELFNWCCKQNCKGDFNCDLCMYNKGRADAIEKIKEFAQQYLIGMMNLENATKYGNKNAKQQDISYGTLMRYEIADCVDDFIDALEQLKGNSNEE
ncbi:MAG: hypothetical protein MJ197_10055 [Bacteroidales bacterium]|nr:hypothetical protein [Bacteroidales bacterium]